ncbi:shikimate kinase [Alkalibacterium sp. 20]|uniref:shikimate kinase n=1 Tax=Alkalibacterium sp. 20 TaxID=1798803 RepID=UPI00090006C4|nr:shikimate kinase [Alkalibacterium sp. 20]OJF97123.1 hypothetical protein AX762_00880 [Alkalibacterium sp. 20]
MQDTIILVGMTGSGKSTIGRYLSDALGYSFIDMDDYIEEKAAITIPELFQLGEDYFRTLESSACQDMINFKRAVISTGGGAIIKQENREALHRAGLIIWIDRPLEHILSDIKIENRPLLASGKKRINSLYTERKELYALSADHVVKNNLSLEDTVDQLILIIKNKEQELNK